MLPRVHVVLGDGPRVPIGMQAAAPGDSARTTLRRQLLATLGGAVQGPQARAILVELNNNIATLNENSFRVRVYDLTVAHKMYMKEYFETVTRQYDNAFVAAKIEPSDPRLAGKGYFGLEFMADSMGVSDDDRAKMRAITADQTKPRAEQAKDVMRQVKAIVGEQKVNEFARRISQPGQKFSTNLFSNQNYTQQEKDDALYLLRFGMAGRIFPAPNQ